MYVKIPKANVYENAQLTMVMIQRIYLMTFSSKTVWLQFWNEIKFPTNTDCWKCWQQYNTKATIGSGTLQLKFKATTKNLNHIRNKEESLCKMHVVHYYSHVVLLPNTNPKLQQEYPIFCFINSMAIHQNVKKSRISEKSNITDYLSRLYLKKKKNSNL